MLVWINLREKLCISSWAGLTISAPLPPTVITCNQHFQLITTYHINTFYTVLPGIPPTSHHQLKDFYTFYANCLFHPIMRRTQILGKASQFRLIQCLECPMSGKGKCNIQFVLWFLVLKSTQNIIYLTLELHWTWTLYYEMCRLLESNCRVCTTYQKFLLVKKIYQQHKLMHPIFLFSKSATKQ